MAILLVHRELTKASCHYFQRPKQGVGHSIGSQGGKEVDLEVWKTLQALRAFPPYISEILVMIVQVSFKNYPS